jgi:hypothetical protein
MNKLTITGLLCWCGCLVILGFQSIATVMKDDAKWESLSLEELVGTQHFIWVDSIDWYPVYKAVDYLITMPLFLLLFILGVIFFVINAFKRV